MMHDEDNVIHLPNAERPGLTEAEVHPRVKKEEWLAEQRAQHRLFCLNLLISALGPNNDLYDEISDKAACPLVS